MNPVSHQSHVLARKPIHKHWATWLVLALMLLGMVIYIFTLDDSRRP